MAHQKSIPRGANAIIGPTTSGSFIDEAIAIMESNIVAHKR